MRAQGEVAERHAWSARGIGNVRTLWWKLSTPALYEQALEPAVVFPRNFELLAAEARAEVRAAGPAADGARRR